MDESIKTVSGQAGRPQDEMISQNILRVTLEIITESGAEGVSLDGVASRAGTSRPAIYRRWKNREELIAAAIESQRPIFAVPDTGSLWGDLHQAIADFERQYGTLIGRQAILSILGRSSANDPVATIWAEKYGSPRVQEFRPIFERAAARNEITPDLDIDLIMFILSSVLLRKCLLGETVRTLVGAKSVEEVLEFILGYSEPGNHLPMSGQAGNQP